MNNTIINIYITFDYELFLGPKTGSVENCLLIPTDKLIYIAKKHNVHFVFFVDVLYIAKMREYIDIVPSLKSDYNKVMTQLKKLKKEGHDLQLHLHPQWYYSSYDVKSESWNMDFEHYKLSDCSYKDIEIMINEGSKIIQSLTDVNPIAFRAGGFSFPIDVSIINLFSKYNIFKDSSALMFEEKKTCFQTYDYSRISEFNSYKFKENILEENANGVFIEYPISCIRIFGLYKSIIERLLRFFHKKNLFISGDGKGIGYVMNMHNSENKNINIRNLMQKKIIRASFDANNGYWVNKIKNTIRKNKQSLMVIYGHPKNMTNYSYKKLDSFLDNLTEKDCISIFNE